MHPIGPELPISAHVALARVCQQLYVLRASYALVQATIGVGTAIIVYMGVAYTRGGGAILDPFSLMAKVTLVTTVFPYTGLLRFLLGPKTQILS